MSVITISRGSLSATVRLAEGLAQRLGHKIVSREKVFEAAKKYRIDETGLGVVKFLDEQPPGFWDRHADQRRRYLACFKASLLDFALEDSIIYHGHLGQFLIEEVPHILRLRLEAPLEFRIQSVMEEHGVTREKAVDIIRDITQKRERWARFLYNVDARDPVYYDMVLNIEKMKIDTATEVASSAAQKPEFQSNDETDRLLRNGHFGAVLKVHLINNPRTHGMELDIEADADTGQVNIYGEPPIVGHQHWETDIKTALKDADNVKQINIQASERKK